MLSFNITILYQKSKRAYSVREHRPGASLKYGTCVYRRYTRGKAIRRYTANISISKTICSVLHSGDV